MHFRILYITILLAMLSCKRSNDDRISKDFELSEISLVRCMGVYEIAIVSDGQQKVSIEGSETQVHKFKYSYSNKELIIDKNPTSDFFTNGDPLHITIHADSMREFWCHEPCTIYTTDTMRGSSFSFYGIADVFDAKFCVKNENVYLYSSHMSFGHIRIDGITNVLNIVSHNEQKVDCGALISTKTYISAKGIGEIITNTTDTLYLSVFRSFKLVEVGSAVIDTMEYYSPYSLVRGK